MAEMWAEPTVLRWWLPDDEVALAQQPVIRECRKLTEERAQAGGGARGGKPSSTGLVEKEGVRDIRAVFQGLTIRARTDGVAGLGSDDSSPSERSDITVGSVMSGGVIGLSPPNVAVATDNNPDAGTTIVMQGQAADDTTDTTAAGNSSRRTSHAGLGDRMSGIWNG